MHDESCPLQQARKNDVALLLVLVAELLAVGTLFTLGPDKHLRTTNGDEQCNRPVARSDNDTNPRENLVHVVGASDDAEAVACGDLALGTASRAKTGQVQVDESVTDFAKCKQQQTSKIHKVVVGTGSERTGVVNGQGAEETRKEPVEEAVLEDVGDGHCVGRELVDKGRLEFALDEVANNHGKGQQLCLGQRCITTGVDVWSGGDDGEMDQDRSEVLNEEDSSPGNLRAYAKM